MLLMMLLLLLLLFFTFMISVFVTPALLFLFAQAKHISEEGLKSHIESKKKDAAFASIFRLP